MRMRITRSNYGSSRLACTYMDATFKEYNGEN